MTAGPIDFHHERPSDPEAGRRPPPPEPLEGDNRQVSTDPDHAPMSNVAQPRAASWKQSGSAGLQGSTITASTP